MISKVDCSRRKRQMPRSKIKAEDLDRILRLRRTKSVRQTAEILEVSTQTVRYYCDKLLAEVLSRWTPPNEPPNEPPDAANDRRKRPSGEPGDRRMPRDFDSGRMKRSLRRQA